MSDPVTGNDIAEFLGQGRDNQLAALAEQHAGIVTAMARAYTRGNGFTEDGVADDIAAVIVTATARLVANPEQLGQTIGAVTIRGAFTSWTLAELFVLNSYRRRTQ